MFLRYFLLSYLILVCASNLSAQEHTGSEKAVFGRVISAQMYFDNDCVLSDCNSSELISIFDSLQPTYVSGLIYLNGTKKLDEESIKAFQNIRNALPDTKLDITLNPNQYKKPEDLVAYMQSINAQVKPDIWYLDFAAGSYKASSKHLSEAIAYAHAQGQQIGGNEIDKTLLKEADFVAIHDGQSIDMKLKDELKKLSENSPEVVILFQINNDSNRSNDDTVHTFIKKWKTHERIAHIKRLAQNQKSWHYCLMYPVVFPVYLRREAYKVYEDGNALEVFKELMQLYN